MTWNKCLKKVCKLNVRTRTCLLSPLTQKPDLKTQLLLRFCTFIKKCMSSENPLIRAVTISCHNSFSSVGQNFRALLGYLKLDFDMFNFRPLNVLMNKLRSVCSADYVITDEIIARCAAIFELCMFLDGDVTIINFDTDDCCYLLYLQCTCDATKILLVTLSCSFHFFFSSHLFVLFLIAKVFLRINGVYINRISIKFSFYNLISVYFLEFN